MGHRITRTGRRLNDTFFRQAKSEGYVARSAFKLLEIQNKHKVIPIGGKVLDLGCHPGAWLQVACQSIGPPTKGGLVVGVDIQKTNLPGKYCDKRVQILQADVRDVDTELWAEISSKGFDTILSDMCHFTHGNSVVDAYKSLELARTAFEIATWEDELTSEASGGLQILKPGGNLVLKLLQGAGTQDFANELKDHFGRVAWHRPKATRSESKEVFLIGLKKK